MTHPYSNPDYARSLAGRDRTVICKALGIPLRLRPIPQSTLFDAAGTYPIAPDMGTPSRADLLAELTALGAVSLVLVSDPLSPTPPPIFDVSHPYKPHHVIDRTLGPATYSKHHRAEVRRALRRCTARQIDLDDHLDDFTRLYDTLIRRHDLGAMHRFDAAHFAHLAAHPQAFPTFGAFVEDRLISAHIWARGSDCAHSHLAASDDEGYATGAAYAVNDAAIQTLSDCTLISLGGAPDGATGAGLDRFKRGFANSARTPTLCGLIVDRAAYDTLSARAGVPDAGTFFPRYRQPQPPD